MDSLELWGGPECSLSRVGKDFRSQFEQHGHSARLSDLDLFAELGISAIRYPVHWEQVAPDDPACCDWSWPDVRLARLRELGIKPIVGLVHHGSGPHYTDLLSDNFAIGLASHARAVAERYDWITDWTPVNEPVTTARFSCLYGHWYPHRRDESSFWHALLNQIDAVRFAMREVRAVNSSARLIQTDDLGRTYATATMRQQAAFDNTRRWIGWDLLSGRVTHGHPLWQRICSYGLEDRLRAIADAPCPPDIIGINHYLTSDRFLDHRLQRYPPRCWGGNGRELYADVEAIRVLNPPPAGLRGLLREVWERYRIPLAVTEVHNGCTREEQMRWTVEAWAIASDLRGSGVDIRAVTSWALLGSTGWDTLLTGDGRYEPGAYDISSGHPRRTATADLLKTLPDNEASHPVLMGKGWWKRSLRLHHPPAPRPAPISEHLGAPDWTKMRSTPPILILGATGTLGRAVAAACRHRDIDHVLLSRSDLELTDTKSIAVALDHYKPWAVVNAAGWVRVDEAEGSPAACLGGNTQGAVLLAQQCAGREIATVTFSSDLVFGGSARTPYVESDEPAPLSVYGHSKAAAEREISEVTGTHLIVRTAAFFSPFDPYNFAVQVVRTLQAGKLFFAADDHIISPTYVPDLCDAVLDLVIDGAGGLWHLTNGQAMSWSEFAYQVAERCGLPSALIEPTPGAALGWVARRPHFAALGSQKGVLLPSLDNALDRFVRDLNVADVAVPQVA